MRPLLVVAPSLRFSALKMVSERMGAKAQLLNHKTAIANSLNLFFAMLKLLSRLTFSAALLFPLSTPATPLVPSIVADLEPATLSDRAIAEGTYRKFERIANQPCEESVKIKNNVRYTLCMVDEGGGEAYLVSASSSLIELGDGVGYWFTPEGDLYAVRFFHSDETFIYGVNGTLLAELIHPRQVRTNFSLEERARLESVAKDSTGIEEIINVFLE